MRIVREQNNPHQATSVESSGFSYSRLTNGSVARHPKLCTDCDKLKYCQYARNLSHNHSAHLTSHIVIDGSYQREPNAIRTLPDQHILAEKLKLRYKTCPFHREISLG